MFHSLRTINYSRSKNIVSNYLSFHRSKKSKITEHPALPIHVSIEPTTSCNLRCPECPSGLRSFTRNTGNLSIDVFQKILKDIGDTLSSMTFYFQGEPFIHPKLPAMISEAHQRGIHTITSTNGHFLTETRCRDIINSGLDKLIVSVDGTTQDVYASYRKEGNLDQVIEGIERMMVMKKSMNSTTPKVDLQFIVFSSNEHQIEEVKDLGKRLEVDSVSIKTGQIYDFENGHELIPKNEQYSRYVLGKDGKYIIKNPLEDHCWKMWHSTVITWDGNIVPCCFDKDATHVMGNVLNDDFKTIWNNSAYQNFRSQLFKSRKEIDICKNCSEGTKVFND